ncbi:hypothetical protein [Singulisphaera sp. GP187]|uniref:hypothetical protein n=1 Tax=Singulisphaera sp. GP187 TaxID=1882752 RepID=UPI001160F6D7|nr:hypothetical protein [Singulisphaera sp. GP187]
MPCRGCGSQELVEERFKRGRHAGKLVCGGCYRFVCWIAKIQDPRLVPSPEIREQAAAIKQPVARLIGESEEQLALATAGRIKMFNAAKRRGDLSRALVLRAVTDAAWFCENARKRYDKIVWPSPAQIDSTKESSGSVKAESPQIESYHLLLSPGETGERSTETAWFAVLDDLQLDQGGAHAPRQLELEAAPITEITEFAPYSST